MYEIIKTRNVEETVTRIFVKGRIRIRISSDPRTVEIMARRRDET
jgi:hypothetical protein